MNYNLLSLCIYLLSLLLSLLFIWVAEHNYDGCKQKRMIQANGLDIVIEKRLVDYVLAFIPLWVIIAFRDKSVGVDAHGTYYRIHRYILYGEYSRHINILHSEGGYILLNRLCIMLNDSYQLMLFATATITWLLFFVYIVRNSKNCMISIFVLFSSFTYFHAFNGIRQYIAIAVVLCGVKYIYSREFFKYLIIVLIAVTFHKSAIILLLLYFLYGVKVKPFRALMCIVGSILFMRVGRGMLALIIMNSKYGNTFISKAAYSSGFAWSDFICNSFLLACGLYASARSENHDKIFDFNVLLQLVAVIIAVNSKMLPIPFRLLWYANFNTMIYIPQLLDKFAIRINKLIIRTCVFIMYFGYFGYYWVAGVDGIQSFSFWNT